MDKPDSPGNEQGRELPEHRRRAVSDFVNEIVGQCPYCGKDVSRTTPRGIDWEEQIGCLACVTAEVATCAVCGKPVTRQQKPGTTRDEKLAHDECLQRR